MLESELFEKECRQMYDHKTQEALLSGRWFTFVDALDDTLDMWHFGRNRWSLPLHNIYIPVKHTIMPKPSMNEHDDIAFRYGKTKDGLAINPIA